MTVDMSAVAATERDLAKLPRHLAESAVAAGMLAMARCLDNGKGSPSECMKTLADAWAMLRGLAPEEVKADGIDDLATARERRRRGATA